MRTLTALRAVDQEEKIQGNSAERLKYLGYQLNDDFIAPAKNYLRFHTEFSDQSHLHGYIDIAGWLLQTVPSVAGIDWFSLDEQIISSLISAYPLDLQLDNQHAPIVKSSIVELVDQISSFADLPRLATPTGVVFVEQFTYGANAGFPAAHPERALENRVMSKLDFILGYSNLPLSALASIEVGDVLLISCSQERVLSGKQVLFTYRLEQESVVLTEQIENNEPHGSGRGNKTMNTENKLNDLPIELSFVLMEKTVTLAELKAMAPGDVLELPADQAMQIEIRANQRSYCRGELVQLANGQLAVEVRQIAS